jgi:hypothetical protein
MTKLHFPNIRIPNPVSALKSAARAAGQKLQSSGSKRDLTKVRSEKPPNADASPPPKLGEFDAARDCLGFLEASKGEHGNFFPQAFQEVDKLIELCFQNNGKAGGYHEFETRVGRDLRTWLRNYDAGEVEKIAKQAKIAIKHSFLGNVDNLQAR